ncbi:MAG: nucleotidyltransferase family protein [Methanoregulaceae archaeon]
MKTTSDISGQILNIQEDLHKRFHVKKIGIFGSYSREEQREGSDIDLIVEFDTPIGMMAFVHLKNLLENTLGMRVDLVTPDGLHPLIRDQIMRDVVYV